MDKTKRKPLPPLVVPGSKQYYSDCYKRLAEIEARKARLERINDIVETILLIILVILLFMIIWIKL